MVEISDPTVLELVVVTGLVLVVVGISVFSLIMVSRSRSLQPFAGAFFVEFPFLLLGD